MFADMQAWLTAAAEVVRVRPQNISLKATHEAYTKPPVPLGEDVKKLVKSAAFMASGTDRTFRAHICCAACGAWQVDTNEGSRRFKSCARCLTTYYCSRECQIAHWAEHKLCCKRVSQ